MNRNQAVFVLSRCFLPFRRRNSDQNAQIITLMGVVLALAVFILAAIPADITSIDIILLSEQSSSLVDEFMQIKQTFGMSMNYHLVSIQYDDGNDLLQYYGDIDTIASAFNSTKNEYFALELQHGNYFNATLHPPWYYYSSYEGNVFLIYIDLLLSDGQTTIRESVTYSLVVKTRMP